MRPFAFHHFGPVLLCFSGMAGCAAPAPPPPHGGAAPAVYQVMVRLSPQAADFDAERIAREASTSAGVSVRYGAAMGPRWHSLVLNCAGEAACAAATQGLANDKAHFDAVELDQQRRAPR